MTIEETAKEIFQVKEDMECENASDEMWMKRDAFRTGAEWMLAKARKWLIKNAQNYYEDSSMHDNCWYDDEQMIEDFQKAMEE